MSYWWTARIGSERLPVSQQASSSDVRWGQFDKTMASVFYKFDQFSGTLKQAKPCPYNIANMHFRHPHVVVWVTFVNSAPNKWCLSYGKTVKYTCKRLLNLHLVGSHFCEVLDLKTLWVSTRYEYSTQIASTSLRQSVWHNEQLFSGTLLLKRGGWVIV